MARMRPEDPKPVFDYSRIGFLEQSNVVRLQYDMHRAAMRLEQKDVLLDDVRFEQAWSERERVVGKLVEFMARVLISVPREWMLADAPEEVDWSHPDSFKWLQSQHFGDLRDAMAEASTPETVSGG
jgi:hypothetical protein